MTKAARFSHRKNPFLFLLVAGIFVGIFFYAKKTESVLPFESVAVKRRVELPKNANDYMIYPRGFLDELSSTPESDLLSLSCTQQFSRFGEGVYRLYNIATDEFDTPLTASLILEEIGRVHAQLPQDQRVLMGKVCMDWTGRMLFEYETGVAASETSTVEVAYGDNITSYLAVSNAEGVFSDPIKISDTVFGRYFNCYAPIQLTREGMLTYHCYQTVDGNVKNWFFSIDLEKKQSTLRTECTYALASEEKLCR